MCKHIHALGSFLKNQNSDAPPSLASDVELNQNDIPNTRLSTETLQTVSTKKTKNLDPKIKVDLPEENLEKYRRICDKTYF